jgi:prophage antirepressor-like protein
MLKPKEVVMTQLVTQGDFLHKDGRYWLTTEQLGKYLGFNNSHNGVLNIHQRNSDELKPFTCTHKMSVQGGQNRDVRLFDEQGCYIVAMLARTPQAKEFRRALARFLLEIRSKEKEFAETLQDLNSLKQQVAAMRIKKLLSLYKMTGNEFKRLADLKRTGLITDRELGVVFKMSQNKLQKLFHLQRLALGDFTDHRPANFKRLTTREGATNGE